MALQSLNLGLNPDDGTGDTLRLGGDKINDNFSEIYTLLGDGTSLTNSTILTSDANIALGDDIELQFGASTDLKIFHDGSNSIIRDAGTGSLLLEGDTVSIRDEASSETMADFVSDGAVTLYHNSVAKLATTATGISVSGDAMVMETNTSGNLLVADGTNFNSIAVSSLSEISTAASDDVFLAIDTSGGGLKKIARSAVVAGLATDSAIANVVDDTSPQLGGNLDMNGADIVTTSNATLDLAPNGTGTVVVRGNTNSGTIVFNCEDNSHGQTLKAQPHSASVTNTMLLPAGANSTLVSLVSTDTLTNKTLTSPVINTGTFGTSILPTSADGTTLGSTSKEFSDLFLADASTIQFGADQDVTLTHVHNTGLLLNTTMVIQFRDSAINIGSPDDGDLDINADDEIELNSTLIDINGAVDISGETTLATHLNMGDSDIIKLGDGADLAIQHDGSDSYIQNSTGSIKIQGKSGEDSIVAIPDGAVTLSHNNAVKLATASGGVTVTGEVAATSLDISGDVDVDGTLEADAI